MSAISSVSGLQGLYGVAPGSQPRAGTASDPDGDGDSSSISQVGQLLSNLQELQQQNPAEFQTLMTQISGQLSTAAQQGTGNAGALNQLASQFQQAGQTGNLSALTGHRGHGHHHHGGGGSSGVSAYTQNQQDPLAALLNSSQNSSQSSSTSTQSLFSTILNEVANAVSGS